MAKTQYQLLPSEKAAIDLPDDHAKGADDAAVFEEVLHRIGKVGAKYSYPDRSSLTFYVEE